jgi:hypothetical protein
MIDDAQLKAIVQAVSQAVLQSIDDLRKRHGNVVTTLDVQERIFQQIVNPGNFSWQAPALPPQLHTKPEFPKRLIRVGQNKEPVEERIVNSHEEVTALRKAGGAWYQWEG